MRLAYAIGPHSTLLAALGEVASLPDGSNDVILELFERASLAEMYSIGQVAQQRVDVIEQLRKLVSNPSTVERQLQKLIETAPWLLHHDWTPLSYNQSLASTRSNFESWYLANYGKEIVTSVMDNPSKQPDFVLLNHEGRFELVEIKRPQHAITDEEFDRAFGYLVAARKFIAETHTVRELFPKATLTIICDEQRLDELRENSLHTDPDISQRNWHSLLESATRRHEDFLNVVRARQGELPNVSMEDE